MQVKTVDAARGKWQGILAHFGLSDRQLSGHHTKCPCCGGVDRFRLDDKDGSGSYICNQCGAGYGIDLVRKITGMEFSAAARAIDQIVGKVPVAQPKKGRPVEEIRAEIKRVLSGTNRIDSTGYLASRGIRSRPDVVFHPSLDYWHEGKVIGKYPAMIGVVRDRHGKGLAIHRTYLKPGGKADVPCPRKMSATTGPLQGGAIRLYPGGETLGVAEGIETACSAHDLFGIPVWSCVSASLLESFVPPDGVRKLIVFADNDRSFAGQKSAYVLANRLAIKGMDVEVRIPVAPDWNDEARRGA